MKKRIISVILCLCVLFAFVPCLAVSASGPFEVGISSNTQTASTLVDSFYSNPYIVNMGYTKDNSILTINKLYLGQYRIYCYFIDNSEEFTCQLTNENYSFPAYGNKVDNYTYADSLFISDIGTFGFQSYPVTTWFPAVIYVSTSTVPYQGLPCSPQTNNGTIPAYGVNSEYLLHIGTGDSFAFSNDRYITGIDLSVNEDDFYQWLIDNDKVSVDVSSGGVSLGGKIPAYIGMAKLKSFIHFYSQFGGSNSSFSKFIWQWFSHMNILNQTVENVNILKQTTDALYQEYLNSYMVTAYNNSANQVHHRRNIETNTTDDDTTLITDDSNDTIDISILRDILRAVIQFQTTFADYMERLFAKIDDLEFVTTVVNDGGSTVSDIDLSDLYIYDVDAFNNDLADFESDIEDVQSVPMGYISTINQNSLMPENMLEDKNSLIVNVPTITGFTVGGNGSTYSTQTGSYALRSVDYPWLDTAVQKIKRFGSIILILGYLVHLRYRVPELIRGE